ncbi:hypothetical protein NQ317_014203 [Molorchus minor]|uniref:Uncharacterized protein n=1 Tax=Molorchus minor TaxID=1323400 RepID=A0ABQ9JAY9_9CUCU|nr:hypothetical protein NQ317_014203 [Molorchus minor]
MYTGYSSFLIHGVDLSSNLVLFRDCICNWERQPRAQGFRGQILLYYQAKSELTVSITVTIPPITDTITPLKTFS